MNKISNYIQETGQTGQNWSATSLKGKNAKKPGKNGFFETGHSQGERHTQKKEKDDQIVKDYIKTLQFQGKSVKNVKYSLSLYLGYIRQNGLDLLRVTIREAQDFQIYLITQTKEDGAIRYSRASALNVIGSVAIFYEHLKAQKYIYSNSFRDIERVKRNERLPRNIFTEKVMDKFLKHFRNFMQGENLHERKQLYKAHVVLELMYSTGARINEIATLKVDDIDWTRGSVYLQDSKTGKSRDSILNDYAKRALKIYCETMRGHILYDKKTLNTSSLFGGVYHLKPWLNGILKRESEKLELGRCTSHNIRHAVGYHLLKGGCDIRYIKEILGHSVLRSSQVYTKVAKEDLKAVIDNFHPRAFKKTSGISSGVKSHEEF